MNKFSKYKYCPVCGEFLIDLQTIDNRKYFKCGECDVELYKSQKLGVIVLVELYDEIVLVKRNQEPFKGSWTTPAGFVEYDESPEQTAIRETKEETGLDITHPLLFGIYFDTDDPRGNTVSIAYTAKAISFETKINDEVSEIQAFEENYLPKNIQFESIKRVLEDYCGYKQ